MNTDHPLIRKTMAVAMEADEQGEPLLALALTTLCRACTMGLPRHTARALVNAATQMVDTMATVFPRKDGR